MTIERHKSSRPTARRSCSRPARREARWIVAATRSLRAVPNKYFVPQQFENPANPEIHRRTTAEEIWRDTDGAVDLLVAGWNRRYDTGVGEVLKSRKPGLKLVVAELRCLAGALRRNARTS